MSGAEKNKGKLRLHTKEDFLKGGTGAGEDIVIKGDATASELIFRITLPKDDEEAMPPLEDEDHYNPITPQELAVMQAWIKMGASFDLLVSELDEALRLLLNIFLILCQRKLFLKCRLATNYLRFLLLKLKS